MKTFFVPICLLGLILVSCEPQSSGSDTGSIVIATSDQNPVASFGVSGNSTSLTYNGRTLVGEIKKDKRKYYDGSALRYVIKFGDNGFKLRNSNEQLIWKVKYYDDKIKVANNEEMDGAYEVKIRDQGKIKVEHYDNVVSEFHTSADKENWITLTDRYKVKGFGQSVAAGLWLVTDISEEERLVLITEVLAANR